MLFGREDMSPAFLLNTLKQPTIRAEGYLSAENRLAARNSAMGPSPPERKCLLFVFRNLGQNSNRIACFSKWSFRVSWNGKCWSCFKLRKRNTANLGSQVNFLPGPLCVVHFFEKAILRTLTPSADWRFQSVAQARNLEVWPQELFAWVKIFLGKRWVPGGLCIWNHPNLSLILKLTLIPRAVRTQSWKLFPFEITPSEILTVCLQARGVSLLHLREKQWRDPDNRQIKRMPQLVAFIPGRSNQRQKLLATKCHLGVSLHRVTKSMVKQSSETDARQT